MLYVITWLTDFAGFLLLFTVERQLAERHTPAFWLGVIGGLFSAANSLSNIVCGRLSDRLGRRLTAAAGMLLLLTGVVAVSRFEPGNGWHLAAYTACGAAFGAIYPPIIGWLGQGRRGRGTSRFLLWFCLAWNAGVVSGQLSGGWLFETFGPNSGLVAAQLLIGVNYVLLFLASSTPRQAAADDREVAASDEKADRARSAGFARLAWVANIGSAFSVSILVFLFPKLIVSLHISAETHGILVAGGRVFAVAAYLLLYATTRWHHRLAASLSVQALGAIGLVGVGFATNLTALAVSLAALYILLGYNYFAGLYYSTASAADHNRSAAGGIHEATLALGMAGGSFFGGISDEWAGERAPYFLAAGVIAVLAAVQMRLYRRLVGSAPI